MGNLASGLAKMYINVENQILRAARAGDFKCARKLFDEHDLETQGFTESFQDQLIGIYVDKIQENINNGHFEELQKINETYPFETETEQGNVLEDVIYEACKQAVILKVEYGEFDEANKICVADLLGETQRNQLSLTMFECFKDYVKRKMDVTDFAEEKEDSPNFTEAGKIANNILNLTAMYPQVLNAQQQSELNDVVLQELLKGYPFDLSENQVKEPQHENEIEQLRKRCLEWAPQQPLLIAASRSNSQQADANISYHKTSLSKRNTTYLNGYS